MNEWGAYVRREREARGWSQKELDRQAGLGLGTTHTWETKGQTPHAFARAKVLRAFGLDQEETFGLWIGRRRRELGLSQDALARRLGYARLTIYRWESERNHPTAEALNDLETVLGPYE